MGEYYYIFSIIYNENIVEDELNLKEPVNLRRNLIILWLLIGVWVFHKDFKKYFIKMSVPQDGVNYDEYF